MGGDGVMFGMTYRNFDGTRQQPFAAFFSEI